MKSMFNAHARLQIALVLIFALIVGVTVAFSSYYDLISSDAVIVYLAGLMRWTPFYWGQDRYGMLIPALTQWIREPHLHMIAQNALHVMTSIASFFLLARYLFPGPRWRETALLALLLFAGLSSTSDIKPFLTPWQIYTPALMFGLGALLVIPHSLILALVLAILAQYCNFAVVLLLGILAAARFGERAGRLGFRKVSKRFTLEFAVLAISAVISYLIRRPYGTAGGKYDALGFMEAVTGWINLLHDYYSTGSTLWLFAAPVILALAAFAITRERRKQRAHRQMWRSFVLGHFALLSYAMVVGASTFAKANGFPRRYLIPSLMIWCVCWAAVTVYHWPSIPRVRFAHRWAAGLAALLAVVIFRFGPPSMTAVKTSLETRFQKTFEQVDKSCTHVAGDYYRVWDSVFYSTLKGGTQLWGVTYRAQVIRDRWEIDDFEKPRVCYWKNNEDEAKYLLKAFGYEGLPRVASSDAMIILSNKPEGVAQSR